MGLWFQSCHNASCSNGSSDSILASWQKAQNTVGESVPFCFCFQCEIFYFSAYVMNYSATEESSDLVSDWYICMHFTSRALLAAAAGSSTTYNAPYSRTLIDELSLPLCVALLWWCFIRQYWTRADITQQFHTILVYWSSGSLRTRRKPERACLRRCRLDRQCCVV